MTWLLQGTMAGASVGMGCGTCCGSGISAFLFGYLTTHTKGIRQSMRAFLSFYLGKVMAVTALCLAASLLGTQILDERGTLFGINVHLATEIVKQKRMHFLRPLQRAASCRLPFRTGNKSKRLDALDNGKPVWHLPMRTSHSDAGVRGNHACLCRSPDGNRLRTLQRNCADHLYACFIRSSIPKNHEGNAGIPGLVPSGCLHSAARDCCS